MKKNRGFIKGIGHHVPNNVITNNDLSMHMDTSDEWISSRSGIKERRFVNGGESTSDLAIPAVENALSDAGISKEDIDFIIFSTAHPDHYIPGSGCILQDKMSFPNIGALDIRAQCAGFVYGLSVADQYIRSGEYNNILLVCSEVQSTLMEMNDRGRNVSVLFGDGAAAAVISSTDEDKGIISSHIYSDGKHYKKLWAEAPATSVNPRIDSDMINRGAQYLSMDGKEVFKHAVKRFPEVINKALDHNSLSVDDIDLLIPHQANQRISDMVARSMKLDKDKMVSNIHKFGNTTSASIPIALSEAKASGRVKDGDIIVCAAFGSGFLYGSNLIRW